VELDAVYAGPGTEADFMGEDVKGKAVFVYEKLGLGDETAGGTAGNRASGRDRASGTVEVRGEGNPLAVGDVGSGGTVISGPAGSARARTDPRWW
jgi:hypothetical protein